MLVERVICKLCANTRNATLTAQNHISHNITFFTVQSAYSKQQMEKIRRNK